MTYENAKRILNPDHENVWRGAAECGGVEIVAEACRKAVAAIDKQIPINPILEAAKDHTKFKCKCNAILLKIYDDGYQIGNKNEYCEKCGQKLDWSVK